MAGLGTRFLPATKAMPKEMLPLVDTPSIQLIVEECVAAGIEEIIFVTARGKSAIEDHFDRAAELEALLERRGKTGRPRARAAADASWPASSSVRQGEARGLGTRCCARARRSATSRSRCCWATICWTPRSRASASSIDVYEQAGTGVIALKEVPAGQEHMYGIADGERDGAARAARSASWSRSRRPGRRRRGWRSSGATCCRRRSSRSWPRRRPAGAARSS